MNYLIFPIRITVFSPSLPFSGPFANLPFPTIPTLSLLLRKGLASHVYQPAMGYQVAIRLGTPLLLRLPSRWKECQKQVTESEGAPLPPPISLYSESHERSKLHNSTHAQRILSVLCKFCVWQFCFHEPPWVQFTGLCVLPCFPWPLHPTVLPFYLPQDSWALPNVWLCVSVSISICCWMKPL